MFITLEDETGIANLIVWPSLFDRLRRPILGAQRLACRGKVQARMASCISSRSISSISPNYRAVSATATRRLLFGEWEEGMRPRTAAGSVSHSRSLLKGAQTCRAGHFLSRTFTSTPSR